MPFYAVAKGKKTGVFTTWAECQEQTTGFKGPMFKKFNTEEEALKFVQEKGLQTIDKRPSKGSGAASEIKEVASEGVQESSVKRKGSDDEGEEEVKAKKSKPSDSSKQNEDDKSDFKKDSEDYVLVYTNGSCGFHGKHGAKAGIGVFFGENHPLNVAEAVKGKATNNTAEIQAATHALELTKTAGLDKVIVHSDSQYLINCASSWLPGWKKNDWKKKDGTEVTNKEDLVKLDKASEGLLVKWVHVKNRSGDLGNEAAVKLAKEGAKSYKAPE